MDDHTNARPTVLVVDDIEVNTMILEEILSDSYNVITAGDGLQALEILHGLKVLPKLILLDVFMPKMTGYEMIEVMKSDATLMRVPVIFITTSDTETEALTKGAVDFISKPFLPDIVKLRVRNQIELKNYSDSLEQMVAEKAEEITSTLNNTLQAMANIIEYRNLESGSHVKRTQLFSAELIKHVINSSLPYADDLRSMEPDIIIKSVALHDVGKIGIPDRILLKPGRLDPEEFEIMKQHTVIGKNIIEAILTTTDSTIYLQHCRDICLCHHERFDGKGYPNGLKGNDIPLSARVVSLVDVYDALVCARVYKAAMSYTEALNIIKDGRGTQFDPLLTDAMLDIADIIEQISKSHL